MQNKLLKPEDYIKLFKSEVYNTNKYRLWYSRYNESNCLNKNVIIILIKKFLKKFIF